MPITFENMITLISCGISFLAVCVSASAVRATKKIHLNAAYFSEMTKAYSNYLGSVTRFAYHRDASARDDLSESLFRIQLFSSDEIYSLAAAIYVHVLGQGNLDESLDTSMNQLADLMRNHLASFRTR